ncbi:MAG: PTS sugar transporter subunit IIA, partial [Candidatus Kapabacteria bacterium]|nr:PTS sugar transporter subunit IIA [Candidatus Kapabacteria bacterium]
MKITDILGKECVVLHSKAHTKDSVLQELLDTLAHSKIVLNKDDVKRAVMERENIMSTGIGNEFALPHGKTNAVTDTIGA